MKVIQWLLKKEKRKGWIQPFSGTSSLHVNDFWALYHPFIASPPSFSLTHLQMFLPSGFYPHPPSISPSPLHPLIHHTQSIQVSSYMQRGNKYMESKLTSDDKLLFLKRSNQERKPFFRDWQPSIFKLKNMLWTTFMGPLGQIAHMTCAKIPENKNKKYKNTKMEREKL